MENIHSKSNEIFDNFYIDKVEGLRSCQSIISDLVNYEGQSLLFNISSVLFSVFWILEILHEFFQIKAF